MKLVLCDCLLNSTLAVIPPLHPVTTQDLKMWWSLIVVLLVTYEILSHNTSLLRRAWDTFLFLEENYFIQF